MRSFDPEMYEPSDLGAGWSPLAIPAVKTWDDRDRPKGWIGGCFGLVVHTTGGGLPQQAKKAGLWPTVSAVNHYSKSHGCHYINGWGGLHGGDLLQVAGERERAMGVGTRKDQPETNQWASVARGTWEEDLTEVASLATVNRWKRRWAHTDATNPLELFPSKYANSCYIHVECIPMVYYWKRKTFTDLRVEALREGLRFTQEQHETVAMLATDIAYRNGYIDEPEWWKSGRLVGHEDVTPLSRSVKSGGWDPGWLRAKPYFDWNYVNDMIEHWMKERAAGMCIP